MSRRRRGRRGAGGVVPPAPATNTEPPVVVPETIDENQEAILAQAIVQSQVPLQQPAGPQIYPSQFIGHAHELAAEIMGIVNKVEMMRDLAAQHPMTPPDLIDRLDGWVDALSVGHAHAGGILAICNRLHEQERGA